MLAKISLVLLSIIFTITSNAQHCPFDGLSIILIQSEAALNKNSIKATEYILLEIDNKKVSECAYSKKLVDKTFKPADSIYKENNWISKYEEKLGVSLKDAGNYYVLLNMAQVNCMIKKGNDFIYRERKFVIIPIDKKNKKQKQITIEPSFIYSLCTSKNDWQDIKPVILKN